MVYGDGAGMTFVDWVENSLSAVRTQGPVYGTREAALDFYLGARNRMTWLRRITGGTRTIAAGDVRARIRQDTETEFTHYRNFHNERELVADVVERVRPSDVFWDVGANVGTYSCLVGQVAAETQAFEPYPPNAEKLRTNLSTNDVSAVSVRELALADRDGETSFAVDDRAEAGAGQGSIVTEGDAAITVPLVRGDALVADGVPAPDVVKIDVEGAEDLVLDGLSQTLADGAPRHVYCEVHSTDWDDVGTRLADHGYDVTVLHQSEKAAFVRGDRAD